MKANQFNFSFLLFAIVFPSHLFAQSLLEKLEEKIAKESVETSDAGYLGLVGDEPGDGSKGVEVISVKPDGPADKSKIRRGDRIVGVDRKVVANMDELGAALTGMKAGETPTFEIVRDGNPLSVEVTLGKRPTLIRKPDTVGESTETIPPPRRLDGRPIIGVNVYEVTDLHRRDHGLIVRSGAFVGSVRAGSPADRAGIRVGNVIVGIDGRRVTSPKDLIDHLALYRPGEKVEFQFYAGKNLVSQTVELEGGPARPAPRREAFSDTRPPSDDRPVIRDLRGILDRFVPPPGSAPIPAPAIRPTEVEELRRQVELLQSQLEQLQRRVQELEKGSD